VCGADTGQKRFDVSELTVTRSTGSVFTKENLKVLLRWNRTAYKAAEVMYENSLLLRHVVEQGLGGVALGRRVGASLVRDRQSVTTWDVPFSAWGDPQHLIGWLRSRGIRVSEGGHTFYIAPQDALRNVIPRAVASYPKQAGFKILKDCRHPLEARYLYKHRRSLRLLRRLIGTPQDQLIAANYMYLMGIGPRVWDLTCWESQGARCAVFVVDHVAGSRPTIEQCTSFRQRLGQLNRDSDLRVLIPHWEKDADFMPPDCNSNLIYSSALGRAQYVDFQNFAVRDRASWSREVPSTSASRDDGSRVTRRPESTDRPPAAMVRSDRKDGRRWSFIIGALRKSLQTLTGRLVLDVGCGSGTTLHAALVAGAAWGVGWDRADVVADTQALLFSLGTTRFTLVGADLHANYRLEDDVPLHLQHRLTGAVVFYSAGLKGIDSLRSLSTIRWDALVYEGGASERPDDIVRRLDPHSSDTLLEVVASCHIADGPHGSRPVMVIRRKPLSA
jgi:SAM-dependent methyltransferase